MNEGNLRELLKRTIAPVADSELQRDLWPRMLEKLDERAIRTTWLDWALAALVAACCLFFPQVIPGLLYHL